MGEKEEEVKIDEVKPVNTKEDLYAKYGLSRPKSRNNNSVNERLIQQEINNERFNCKLKLFYQWCTGLCGLGGDSIADDVNTTAVRVPSSSYLNDNHNE